eukprot:gene6338-10_t
MSATSLPSPTKFVQGTFASTPSPFHIDEVETAFHVDVLILGCVFVGMWIAAWAFVLAFTSDAGFGAYGTRVIETGYSVAARRVACLCIFGIEGLQLAALCFAPSVPWPSVGTAGYDALRYGWLWIIGPASLYALVVPVALLVLVGLLVGPPLLVERWNFRHVKQRVFESVKDLAVFGLPVPALAALLTAVDCRGTDESGHYTDLVWHTQVSCFSTLHLAVMSTALAVALAVWAGLLLAAASRSFYAKPTDLGYSGRWIAVQAQFKALAATSYAVFRHWPEAHLAVMTVASICLLVTHHTVRPCYVEKVNYWRSIMFCLTIWTVLCGWLALVLDDLDHWVPLACLGGGYVLLTCVAWLKYLVGYHTRAYCPKQSVDGVYQGDLSLGWQTMHGRGSMVLSDGS